MTASIIIEKEGWSFFNLETRAYVTGVDNTPLFFEDIMEAASYAEHENIMGMQYVKREVVEERELENESNS